MIEKEDIERLKEIFVTREECNETTEEIKRSISTSEKDLAVIRTKLNYLVAILSTFGTAIVGSLIGVIIKIILGV